ncbi:MAG: hypothetical protein AAFP84_13075 [Actinomycetota bacterium]
MARRRLVRNTEIETPLAPLRIVLDGDVDSSFCQVPDPARAASSTGVSPHLDRLAIQWLRRPG